MAVYTEVSFDEAAALIDGLGIGALQALAPCAGGIENTNYFADTASGRYVLTVFERLGADELPFYLQLMKHLAEHALPVPRPHARQRRRRCCSRSRASRPRSSIGCPASTISRPTRPTARRRQRARAHAPGGARFPSGTAEPARPRLVERDRSGGPAASLEPDRRGDDAKTSSPTSATWPPRRPTRRCRAAPSTATCSATTSCSRTAPSPACSISTSPASTRCSSTSRSLSTTGASTSPRASSTRTAPRRWSAAYAAAAAARERRGAAAAGAAARGRVPLLALARLGHAPAARRRRPDRARSRPLRARPGRATRDAVASAAGGSGGVMKLQLVPARRGLAWVQEGASRSSRASRSASPRCSQPACSSSCCSADSVRRHDPAARPAAGRLAPVHDRDPARDRRQGADPGGDRRASRAPDGRASWRLLKLGIAYAAATFFVFWLAGVLDGGALEAFLESLSDAKTAPESAAAHVGDPRLQFGLLLRLTFAAAALDPVLARAGAGLLRAARAGPSRSSSAASRSGATRARSRSTASAGSRSG